MRRAAGLAVSSALLFLSTLSAPHHADTGITTSSLTDRVLISEFYPCALSSDEYVVLVNAGSSELNLRNWSVTDGEGTLTFASDLMIRPGRSVAMSMNSTSFARAFGRSPEVSIPEDSVLERAGTFKLADGGDTVELSRPDGSSADAVAYGDVIAPGSSWVGPPVPRIRQGEVAKRIASGTAVKDTNRSLDWFPFREYRYGFTEFQPFGSMVPAGSIAAFVSPDCSLECVVSRIDSASTSLRICTYEIGSIPVCQALLRAHSRGVDVRLLVDGAPAGGLKDDEVACLSVLWNAGLDVLAVNGNLSERCVQHIGALHAKYMVVDELVSMVMSENFVKSGLPQDRIYGNRGWGIEVVDSGLASHLSCLFDSDSRLGRPDVKDWGTNQRHNASAALPRGTNSTARMSAIIPFRTAMDARVQAVISPDASVTVPYLSPLIECSRELKISQFQADVSWESRWTGTSLTSPLAESVVAALRAGASVRGLFDSSWYNAEGNKRIVSLLSGVAANESLDGEFAQLDPRSPISILHNKGAIFDAKRVLVSSNNWCSASFAKNRELALMVESEEVAKYFTRAFEMDWTPDTVAPLADAGLDRTVIYGNSVALDSSGSSDDRAIASWSWDLGGDGTIECADEVFEFHPDRTGRFRVVLTVEDAWGNEGSDTVYISAVEGSRFHGAHLPERAPWWTAATAGILGAFVGVLLARRRARSHNVNH